VNSKKNRTILRELGGRAVRAASPALRQADLRLVAGGAPEGTHDYISQSSHWDHVRVMACE
jgi:hypothetical protein